jgi:hypothetical protein
MDGDFDPREAADLLEQTRRQAQRQFNPHTPVITIIQAFVALIGFGALWLSVRDQHPYKGPEGWALAVLYPMLAILIILVLIQNHRANEGVGRKDTRQARAAGAVIGVAWVAVYVYMGALAHAGASHSILYGVYPATGPLMIVGLVAAAVAGAREEWPLFAGALGVAGVAAIAAYTGPVAAWLVMGVGLFAVLAVISIVRTVRPRP